MDASGACAAGISFVALSGSQSANCALDLGGQVWCWGESRDGNLGLGRDQEIRVPTRVPGLSKVVAFDTSASHTCGVTSDGRVRCQGPQMPLPGHPVGLSAGPDSTELPGIAEASAVSVGYGHTCVLGREGGVTCWGPPDLAIPASGRAITDAVAVSGKSGYACALVKDGTVYCWGESIRRDLGLDPAAPELVRMELPVPAKALAVGWFHGCAVLEDGRVMCWGLSYFGALGDSGDAFWNDVEFAPPEFATGIDDAVAIAVGVDHTCAQLGDGTVRCWGSNYGGTLGDGTTSTRFEPVAVPGLVGVTALSAGEYHSCALRDEGDGAGALVCWGRNDRGQIGNGEDVDAARPVPVPGLAKVVSVAAGGEHTCVATDEGETLCFGDNTRHQVSRDGSEVMHPRAYPGVPAFAAIASGALSSL